MNLKQVTFAMLATGLFVLTGLSLRAQKHLQIGDAVPAFSLLDQNGKTFNSKDHVGKHILVIFFYPKDQSLVCTKEACQFRDSFTEFTKAGAEVIGINSGSVASHKAFADADKLPFTLLSDPDNKVLNLFGVKSKLFMTGRETFVIGLDGKIGFQYAAMLEGKDHSNRALQFVKTARK